MKIQFQTNYKKTLECILWILHQQKGIDLYKIMKILFHADYLSVNKYGVPVTGDTYKAMDYGTVPSFSYDVLKQEMLALNALEIDSFPFKIKDKRTFMPLRDVMEDYLSETDKECLTLGLQEYGNLSFEQVKEKNHTIKAWQDAYKRNPNSSIDWYDLIEDPEIRKDLEETASYLVV